MEKEPEEKDGRLWVDRIIIDDAACIHCGECVKACTEENKERNALTNVVQKAIREAKKEKEPNLLQKLIRMDLEERKRFWDSHFVRCIKCYGCIDQCPVREEEEDELRISEWIKQGEVPPRYPEFHLIRAYQVWDRCILCGECEETCPAGIPLKTLQDITQFFSPEDAFKLVPGLSEEVKRKIIDFVRKRMDKNRRMRYEL